MKTKRFVTFLTMKRARDRLIESLMLDMLILKMKFLTMLMKVKSLEEEVKHDKDETVKKITWNTPVFPVWKQRKPINAVAIVRPVEPEKVVKPKEVITPEEFEEQIVFGPEEQIVRETEVIDEEENGTSVEINQFDLAPQRYPWDELTADIGPLAPWEPVQDPHPERRGYPETPPELTSNDEEETSDDEIQIISPSETPPSRTHRFFTPPPPADENDEDNEVQILEGPTQGQLARINGRRYTSGPVLSRVRGSTMRRAMRIETASGDDEDDETQNQNVCLIEDTYDDLLDSEEDDAYSQ